MELRPINITVGGNPTDWAYTYAYRGAGDDLYVVPTYTLTLSGTDSLGFLHEYHFDAIRFGVSCNYNVSGPVGQKLREKGVGRTRGF